jgi:integrase
MPQINITEHWASRVKSGPTDIRYTDESLPGFGLRVNPSGRKSWFVTYRSPISKTPSGQPVQREQNLGLYPAMSPKDARSRAVEIKQAVQRGEDPFAPAPTGGLTIDEFWDQTYKPHLRDKKGRKPRTIDDVDAMVRVWLKPKLGHKPMAEITAADIEKLHDEIGSTHKFPYRANAMVRYTRPMFKLAIKRKVYNGSNPCEGIELFKETKRTRRLTIDELYRLWQALDAMENDKSPYNPNYARAVRAMLLTPNRKMEVVDITWEMIDSAEGGFLTDSKNGEINIPMTKALTDLFKCVPRIKDNPFVFTSTVKDGGRISTVHPKAWRWLMKKAGIANLRIHDLRRSVASFALNNIELPLDRIGTLLNHKTLETTKGYAYLEDVSKAKDAERVSAGVIDLATKRAEKQAA